MSINLSRRDLLRRGVALAGGLLASGAFVSPLFAAPAEHDLSARLLATPITHSQGTYGFELTLLVRNDGTEVVTLEAQEVTLTVSVALDPNAAPVALNLSDQALRSRSMPSRYFEVVAGTEQLVTTYWASFPSGFVPGLAWQGQVLRGDGTVAVGVSEQRCQLTCPSLELRFPAA